MRSACDCVNGTIHHLQSLSVVLSLFHSDVITNVGILTRDLLDVLRNTTEATLIGVQCVKSIH